MIKELYILIRLLFSSPKRVTGMSVMEMKHFPFKGFRAMSWCGFIVTRKEVDQKTINHESIHLAQAKDKGSWVRYYTGYLLEWLKGNPFRHDSYLTSKYEVEAYAKELDEEYLERRAKGNVRLFKLKDRHKLYSTFRSSYEYKDYLKQRYVEL